MLIESSDLIGVTLDWAVSAARGDSDIHPYSTSWADVGPIIDLEEITVARNFICGGWTATMHNRQRPVAVGDGPTPLIAAMRCYVDFKLGRYIDVPSELLKE